MKHRLTSVKELLKKNKFDALLISSVPNIVYLTNYAGFSTHEREAYLLITRLPKPGTGGQAKSENYLFTDGRYITAVKSIADFTVIEISVNNSLTNILKKLTEKKDLHTVGFEATNITVAEHKALKKCFPKFFPTHLRDLRLIKQPDEIVAIKNACALGDKAFNYILGEIKPEFSEKDIAFLLEIFIKKNGGDLSFSPIVAFGENAAIPHHVTGDKKLPKNSLILLDFGVKLNNYCSDITRTIFIGSADAESKKIYQVVFDAQQKAIAYLSSRCHPELVSGSYPKGIPKPFGLAPASHRGEQGGQVRNDILAKEVDKIAREYIISQGFPSIPHSLGHGIGIEVHEAPTLSPRSKDILKAGMVFSIEPGIYIPGFGGVRIEDLVVLEASGPKLLTKSRKEFIQL